MKPVAFHDVGDAPSRARLWTRHIAGQGEPPICHRALSAVGRVSPLRRRDEQQLTINAGNCNHRRYIPVLLDLVETCAVGLTRFVTNPGPLSTAIEAYKAFDERQTGWVKVELIPELAPVPAP